MLTKVEKMAYKFHVSFNVVMKKGSGASIFSDRNKIQANGPVIFFIFKLS